MKNNNPYDDKYGGDELYWGSEPSSLARRLVEHLAGHDHNLSTVIDLGCGEGRNAVYLTESGLVVTGLDAAKAGLDTMSKVALASKLSIAQIHGDVISYQFEHAYDIVFSTGTLHYLPYNTRAERFDHFKNHTPAGGLHAHSVFVEKPFVPHAPDTESTAFLYRSGELMSYYWDWEIVFSEEAVFDCNSGGIPHRHAVNRIIARRPQQS